MTQRNALLLGSMPYQDEREAMSVALGKLGPSLVSLPDGEIGERSDAYPVGDRAAWVGTIMDRCERDTTAWKVLKPARRNETGTAEDYDAFYRLKPLHKPSEMAAHIDFGWRDFARESYPIFRQLRDEAGLPDLKFQVGLPTALGVTFGMLSPVNAMRYAPAFNTRLAFEANDISGFVDPGDLVFQLEVPGEMAMAYKLPTRAVKVATRTVLGLVRQIEPRAPFGIHLCFGDLNNKALIDASTLDKMVAFSNSIVDQWPSTHALDYVHVPLAEAADPPPLDPEWYQPLREMNLPAGTRFVAGFVHDKRTEDEHRQIRSIVESLRGGPVDIASSCGLGRRTRDIADGLIDMTAKMVSDE